MIGRRPFFNLQRCFIILALCIVSACEIPKVGTGSGADGIRVSSIVGISVYNDHGDKIGSIDDLNIRQNRQIGEAIISVGGFLGIGSKLVAIPYEHLTIDMRQRAGHYVILPGASKDKLNAMTDFTYRRNEADG